MKYSKQILSDALAELGASLGRPPGPSDLRPGMAVKKTYLRWFGDWETALEYAGYPKEDIADPGQADATEAEAGEGTKPAETVSPWRNSSIVNLLPWDAYLIGTNKTIGPLKSEGVAQVTTDNLKVRAGILLREQTGGVPIVTSYHRNLAVKTKDGSLKELPLAEKGIFYIVRQEVALAARSMGLKSGMLLYPKTYARRQDFRGGALLIHQLGVTYDGNLWIAHSERRRWHAKIEKDKLTE